MIESLLGNLPVFITDAISDTLKLVPSLLIIFIVIEIFENYFAHKTANIVSFSKKLGPVFGALLAIIPQCGFSVIMTTLFIKRYITVGTLIAVYIATSDEAIPVLFANPEQAGTILKIILIKLTLAIFVGYMTDLFIKSDLHECREKKPCSHIKSVQPEIGCCKHNLTEDKIKNIIIHPIKHTAIISLFVFVVCLGLNYLFGCFGEKIIANLSLKNSILEIILFAFFGLIPNCAVSVLITMAYIKSFVTFASVISGLVTNAGLGLLILFTRKRSLKKYSHIVGILLLSGIVSGILVQLFL